MIVTTRRLQLRYNPGTFTFRHFDAAATDQELYDLANQINSLQEDEVSQIVRVQISQLF